jgi:rhodanese-related sulfurtransferase
MFNRNNILLPIILILLAVVVAACNQRTTEDTDVALPAKNSDGYTDITVDQLAGMLESKDFTMVNVHIPYEGDLPQTDLSIPYNEIEANLSQLPASKDAQVVIYCRSGNMSTQAAKTLVGLGYTNVIEVDGGMNAWENSGRALLSR